jgi:hypothetical protein
VQHGDDEQADPHLTGVKNPQKAVHRRIREKKPSWMSITKINQKNDEMDKEKTKLA